MEENAFNPSRRRLCPDGACVGLLGSDGRCRVCGRRGDGGATADNVPADADDAGDDRAADAAGPADASADADENDGDRLAADSGAGAGGGAGFRADRRLCDDGSCVGIVDANGVCAVCGLRAAG